MVGEKIVPRGFLKSYILKLLSSGPKHGYGIKPSPGGIYTTLHELEKKRLIIKFKEGRRKYYKLTKEGRIFIERFDKSLNEMKDRFRDFVGVMSQILDFKGSELKRMMGSHIKSQRSLIFILSPSLRKSLFKSRKLIFKIAQDKTKYEKLEKILKETVKKLEKISSEMYD